MLWLVLIIVLSLFCLVIIFGAPYVPTLANQRRAALDLLELRPGQLLYELGCGDGQLMLEAAARGIQVVGFELNPLLVAVARWRTRHHRSLVEVRWANFWWADLTAADGVFVFLIDHYMDKLNRKLRAEVVKPLKVASVAFAIPSKRPVAKRRGVYLYHYVASGSRLSSHPVDGRG